MILISEAGWRIEENRVYRLDTGIPSEGVSVTVYPSEQRPVDWPPHIGIWQKMTQSQTTLAAAFKQMGVRVTLSGDKSLAEGTVGIYFGPEPQEH